MIAFFFLKNKKEQLKLKCEKLGTNFKKILVLNLSINSGRYYFTLRSSN